MKLRDIPVGTTVDIRYQQAAAREDASGQEGDTYRSDVFDVVSDTEFEMQVPIMQGKVVMLPENIRYEVIFYTKGGLFRGIGRVTARYKKDKFPLYKIEILKDLEKFQRREFFRFACSIPVSFSVLEEEDAELDTMEEILSQKEDKAVQNVRGLGTILDISGGGIRFSSTMDLSDYHFLLLRFSLESESSVDNFELIAMVVGTEYSEDADKYINRVRILFKNSDYQEKIVRYIFEEERRIRRKSLE